jgi:hypothetical protein
MRTFLTFAAVIAIAAAAGAQPAKSPQKPGKWQVTMQMDMPGMPMKMPEIKTEVCLTEQDLADPQKAVPKDQKSDCKISDYKVSGNNVTWAMECPSQKMKGTGEATYSGDSYTANMKMETGDQKMSMKQTGKWLGTCTK